MKENYNKTNLCKETEKLFDLFPFAEEFTEAKNIFFSKYFNVSFRYKSFSKFKHHYNPVIKFNDANSLILILKREKSLALDFQKFENSVKLHDILKDINKIRETHYFYLDYEFQEIGHNVHILFDTNSLIFKNNIVIKNT